MTIPANPGAETAFSSAGGRKIAESDAGFAHPDGYGAGREKRSDHDPEAKALLRRYLSEVHSFRETGNHALRNLEARLATMPFEFAPDDDGGAGDVRGGVRAAHGSQLVRPSLPVPPRAQPSQQRRPEPGLHQRLHELSAYLHADLSREPVEEDDDAPQAAARPRQPVRQRGPQTSGPHKIPTLPVLDRAWFEERFALMRTSMDRLTEQLPLKRLDALEVQFRELMEGLAQRETARDPRPLDASLKELAAYLSDSRQWAVANEKRVKGLEDKLERLGKLVAQSHAAISATAKGLELVAKGTGETLARKTADLVMSRIGKKIEATDPAERLDQLGREVAHLTAQSRHLARNAEDRLEQIQTALKEKSKPAPAAPMTAPMPAPADPPGDGPAGAARAPKAAAPQGGGTHAELESYLNQPMDLDDDYDSDMIAAAQHAARLADGPAQSASSERAAVRYQIPYGEFLPDENSPPSRIGLIVAIVILALAGATMAFLKWYEWTLVEPKPAVTLEEIRAPVSTATKQARLMPPSHPETPAAPREAAGAALFQGSSMGTPVVTGSTPAAPPLGTRPMELWVSSRTPDKGQPEPVRPNPVAVVETTEANFREAAIKGDLSAQLSVGQSYLSGKDHDGNLSVPDPVTGVRWIRRSAERGHAPAQYKLATLYELGHGIPRDLAEAQGWYEKAALQGYVKAMHNLAVLAASQNGKAADYLTAARWFKEAASYGLVDSEFNLGILYERGFGVARDLVEAYRWFALAALQDDDKARQKRDEVAKLLTPAERRKADRLIAEWSPKSRAAETSRSASDVPAGDKGGEEKRGAPRAMQTTSAAVVNASWQTDVAASNKPAPDASLVMEAQRLLRQRGYDPGPADGVPGPRTQNAIRSFQRKAGLPATGEASEVLIVKLAFLPL